MYWLKVQKAFINGFWEVVLVGRNGKYIMRSKRMRRRMDAVRLARKIDKTAMFIKIKSEGGKNGKR